MERNLTTGSVFKNIVIFSLPYFLSYFLQTLYGLADLFIIGHYEGVASTTAVSVGSQVMHMLTVMIVCLAMGSTVAIGRAVGAGDRGRVVARKRGVDARGGLGGAGRGGLALGRGDDMDRLGRLRHGGGCVRGRCRGPKGTGVVGRHGLCLRSNLGLEGQKRTLALRPLSLSAAKVTGHRSSLSC